MGRRRTNFNIKNTSPKITVGKGILEQNMKRALNAYSKAGIKGREAIKQKVNNTIIKYRRMARNN